MAVLFVPINASLDSSRLNTRRRRLSDLLRAESVGLKTCRLPKDGLARSRFFLKAQGAVIVAMDDAHALPEQAPWLQELADAARDLEPRLRPRVIYVTRSVSAAGVTQALEHPVVQAYVRRDDGHGWVDEVAEAALEQVAEVEAGAAADTPTPAATKYPEIIGVSPCFREAVEDLNHLLHSPYGLVTGPPGVGKLFLIRTLWRQMTGRDRVVILACGSFFKDYFIAGSRRRFGGGREAIDQLVPYLNEADGGLLVLHHIEQLPTAVQRELEVRLSAASDNPKGAVRFLSFDDEGLLEPDVRVVATSTFKPELLARTGRLVPDLVRVLRKRHVRVPSLAERGPEDVRLLCEGFLGRIARAEGQQAVPRLDPAALRRLTRTAWPNNLTDLVRVLEKAFHACRGRTIRLQDLPLDLVAGVDGEREMSTLDEVTAQAQRAAILNALEQTGGSVAEAAKLLGRNRAALYRLMRKLGMKPGRRQPKGG